MISQPETQPQAEEPHVHHWVLDEESHGRCRGCGEERDFQRSIKEYGPVFNRIWNGDWDDQDEATQPALEGGA